MSNIIQKFIFKNIIRPEYPTKCSFERRKLFYRPSFNRWLANLREATSLFKKSETDHLDNDDYIQETIVINQNNQDKPIYLPDNNQKILIEDSTNQQGVTLYQLYCQKEILRKNMKVIQDIKNVIDNFKIEGSEYLKNSLEYLTKVISESPLTPYK
ncbi:26752_t:CDS:2 [Racocetra persica]|uniref:26752_t:CDS:1 n=1 Tax=Racocetra persica TaxID=160502 RepID=A0ACA9MU15_9GLOM|nr:26752_t:CDS:2 [Racocetra persica]